ncbi:MAG: hypothetical protein KF726_23160 [Anaerolineae bacterium]|nr:hypothetical protein [Anaerolineae bacterium]
MMVASLSYLVLLLLCIAVIRFGHSQPRVAALPELAICDDMPCYRGITLNSTTWEQALEILKNTSGFEINTLYNGAQAATGPVERLITFSGDEGIFEIDLFIRPGTVSFKSLLIELGSPCMIYPAYPVTVVSFRDRLVWISATQTGITPDSSVLEIDLGPYSSSSRFTAEQQARRCRRRGDGTIEGEQWAGFRHYSLQ